MTREEIFREIVTERDYQDAKWGETVNRKLAYTVWLTVLTEEVGEVAQAVLKQTYGDLRAELIQVAAVATAMLECIEELAVNPNQWGFSHDDAG